MKLNILVLSMIALIQAPTLTQELTVFERWHKTDQLIRDRKIDEDDAKDSIAIYVKLGKKEFKNLGISGTKREDWVFPMDGWTSCTYRSNGNDYKDERFDYFQGGEFKGHPAHDIFFPDCNNDAIEDSTGKKVYATAMVTGIVISTYNKWWKGDYFRSGNYVKMFDPVSEAMFYYSHLDTVFVQPGELVKAGDPIGYVGRTGRKAINGRTHVHIAYYKIDEGHPIPEDIIFDLYLAQKKTGN
ncbi:MAG: M23 family metallopeptidase [Ignavibacteria bacterium]|nr:M23 family metallopeptidase [Ignavibacteria bacterium]